MSDGLHQNKIWNRNWVKLWIVMVHLLHKMNVEPSTMVGCQDTSTPKDRKHWVKADESRTQTFLLRSYYVPTTFLLGFCHGKRSRYDIIRHHTTIRPSIRDMVWSQDLPRSTEPPSRAFAQNCPDLTNVKTCQNQSIGQSRSIKTMVTICYHGSAMLFLESLYHFRITITGPYWNWIDWWKLLQRLRSGQSMLITSSCRSTWHNYTHLCRTNIAHHRSS